MWHISSFKKIQKCYKNKLLLLSHTTHNVQIKWCNICSQVSSDIKKMKEKRWNISMVMSVINIQRQYDINLKILRELLKSVHANTQTKLCSVVNQCGFLQNKYRLLFKQAMLTFYNIRYSEQSHGEHIDRDLWMLQHDCSSETVSYSWAYLFIYVL